MNRVILTTVAALSLGACALSPQEQAEEDFARNLLNSWIVACDAYDEAGKPIATQCVHDHLAAWKAEVYRQREARDMALARTWVPPSTVYVERDTPVRVPMIYPNQPPSATCTSTPMGNTVVTNCR